MKLRSSLAALVVLLCLVVILTAGASAGTEKVLYTFTDGSDGGYPADTGGLLVRDTNGNLYGTVEYGGSCGDGAVFKLSRSGVETVLHNFCGSDGANPYGALIRDSAGTFYGTTVDGGAFGCGTVWGLSGSTLTTLYSFTCGSDGGNPYAGVIRDSAGNLYGTTPMYGTYSGGVVYEISSGAFSVLYTFCSNSGCTDGEYPYGGLTADGIGNLYGTTFQGGTGNNSGTVFKLSKSGAGWRETVLYNFTDGSDGEDPNNASLTLVHNEVGGKQLNVVFGVAWLGGANNIGTAFSLTEAESGYKFSVIHTFAGPDGEKPLGTLTYVKGKLYGTTEFGGTVGGGTVFELASKNQGWTETVLYSFTGGSDGDDVRSGVISDSKDNLYGVTFLGGGGAGVVYQVVP
ncbi:MAG: choice-of-anchor tandem repeat GloVer-containing protein [Candidatus Sulfotelmatobacter sp.]|jgi:uncharacterized repeat protein (TIGR03803 family)